MPRARSARGAGGAPPPPRGGPGATRIEVRPEPHERYFALMQRRVQSTVFFNNGCAGANSYYFDHHGDAPLLRPGGSLDAWWSARRLNPGDYAFSNGANGAAADARAVETLAGVSAGRNGRGS